MEVKEIVDSGSPGIIIKKKATHWTQELILSTFLSKFGGRYDYSRVSYKNIETKVDIKCKKHDTWFSQIPKYHLAGREGCPKCIRESNLQKISTLNRVAPGEWRARIVEKYGDKYDYSRANFNKSSEKIEVVCKKHGISFYPTISNHFYSGTGCPECGKELRIQEKTTSKEEFIAKARSVHGDKYSYEKSTFRILRDKILITCPIHGDFQQKAMAHLVGHGCPKCAGVNPRYGPQKSWTLDMFLEESQKVFGDRYDYSGVKFHGISKKVEIRCIKHNILFTQNAFGHVRGETGCPECAREKLSVGIKEAKGLTPEVMKARAIEVHGNLYDYSKSEFKNTNDKIEIICRIHGPFFTQYQSHVSMRTGCPKCGALRIIEKRTTTKEEFIKRAKEAHRKKNYDYSKVGFKTQHDSVTIICPKHGEFSQIVVDHLAGHGCPHCSGYISKPAREIRLLLRTHGIRTKLEHKLPSNQRIDLFAEERHIGIEYNGTYWHSEKFKQDRNYHLNKTIECRKEGIRLIHVWESDWVFNRAKTEQWLLSQFGVSSETYDARKCTFSKVHFSEVKGFLDQYHMLGAQGSAEHCYVLKNRQGEVVSTMTFSSKDCKVEGEICLDRFCSRGNVRGAFPKLLRHAIEDLKAKFSTVVSFSDKSWSQGGIYLSNGFICTKTNPPQYWWAKGARRFNRRGFQRKYLPQRLKIFDEKLTEAENCRANGYTKIFDCGTDKWVLKI